MTLREVIGGPGLVEFSFRYAPQPGLEEWHGGDHWQPHEGRSTLCTGVLIPSESPRAVDRVMRIRESMVGLVPRRPGGGFERTWCVWARCESAAHAEALARFRPGPTLVIREGRSVKRTAVWHLSKPMHIGWCEKANLRIAYRLRTPRKWAAPESMFYAPGCSLSTGKPVWVEHSGEGSLSARAVVGHLADPPEPKRWREVA